MIREYGKLYISMWYSGNDFITLNARAQRLYMFLISQPDINPAGVVTIALKRWSHCTNDLTPTEITNDLHELHNKRFIIVDEDCEELLIRSFIKWEARWTNPTIMREIKQACQQVMSANIRAGLQEELERLDPTQIKNAGPEIKTLINDTINSLTVPSKPQMPIDETDTISQTVSADTKPERKTRKPRKTSPVKPTPIIETTTDEDSTQEQDNPTITTEELEPNDIPDLEYQINTDPDPDKPETMLTADWKPNPVHAMFAKAQNIDLDTAFATFQNKYLNLEPTKTASDWNGMFTQWMLLGKSAGLYKADHDDSKDGKKTQSQLNDEHNADIQRMAEEMDREASE